MIIRPVRILPATCVVQCEVSAFSRGAFFFVSTVLPPERGGANKQSVYVWPSKSQSVCVEGSGKRACLGRTTVITKCLVYISIQWPCQGHHMPACLAGLLETWRYWTKAAALQRHTQQLFSATAYHLMTLMEGRATHDLNASSLRGKGSH